MCRGGYRKAGIAKFEEAHDPLFGAQGMALVEYTGEREGHFPASVYSGVQYPYYPGRTFYVDVRDLSRVLAWKENSQYVFMDPENNGASPSL